MGDRRSVGPTRDDLGVPEQEVPASYYDSSGTLERGTRAGKPIGTVQRKKYGAGNLRRTQNWDQGGKRGVIGMGYTSWTTHTLNKYWRLGKAYTYMYEGENDEVFERSAELFMYIDCPSLEKVEIPETTPLTGAVVRSVIVDIYYHDL